MNPGQIIPTVLVVFRDGRDPRYTPLRINASDFDEGIYCLFSDYEAGALSEPEPEPAAKAQGSGRGRKASVIGESGKDLGSNSTTGKR